VVADLLCALLSCQVLTADTAGHQFHKAHEYANYALAGML